jgi:hypothetical protein
MCTFLKIVVSGPPPDHQKLTPVLTKFREFLTGPSRSKKMSKKHQILTLSGCHFFDHFRHGFDRPPPPCHDHLVGSTGPSSILSRPPRPTSILSRPPRRVDRSVIDPVTTTSSGRPVRHRSCHDHLVGSTGPSSIPTTFPSIPT